MRLSALFTDEDAQSEVLGAILLVAVIIMLVGILGTAVFSFGDRLAQEEPRVEFAFAFNRSASTAGCGDLTGDGAPDTGELTVTHDGGSAVEGSQLTIHSQASGDSVEFDADCGLSRPTPGSSTSVLVDSDDTVRVVWESESGGPTVVLEKWTGPDA